MKNRKRTLSVLTALLLMGASNNYDIKRSYTILLSKIEVYGKTSNRGIIDTGRNIATVNEVIQLISPLKNEDYLLPENEFDLSLKKTPKIKGGK